MSTYDFKKEEKALYCPKAEPSIITVPPMKYVSVLGKGDPNEENGAYSTAIGILYAISYTIKMSYKGSKVIEGFFEYVVPPLEGVWWMEDGSDTIDYENKSKFNWVAMIRLPDFVTDEIFEWAKAEAAKKKKISTDIAKLITINEGLCAQIMHIGSFDDEPISVAKLDSFVINNGYKNDINDVRRHHEIYLSDPRKTAAEKCKTIIRHPIAKIN